MDEVRNTFDHHDFNSLKSSDDLIQIENQIQSK